MEPTLRIALALAVLVAACGARTELEIGAPGGDGGRGMDSGPRLDASRRDGGTPRIDGGPPRVDGGPRPDAPLPVGDCRWDIGPASLLSEDDDEPARRVERIVIYDDGAIAGWVIRGTTTTPTRRFVRRVDADAVPVTPMRELLRTGITPNVANMGLAVLGADVGVLGWDLALGCRFERLDAMLDPLGPTHTIFISACGQLLAMSDGYSFLHESPETLETPNALAELDRTGARRSTTSRPLIDLTEDPFGSRRVDLGDGGFLLGWRRRSSPSPELVVRGLDETGDPTSDPDVVGGGSDLLLLYRGFGGAVAGRVEQSAGRVSRIGFVVFDRDGRRVGDEQELALPDLSRLVALEIAPFGLSTAVLWIEDDGGRRTAFVQELSSTGALVGERASFDAGASGDGPSEILAATVPDGLIAAYTEASSSGGRRVFARALRCLPP